MLRRTSLREPIYPQLQAKAQRRLRRLDQKIGCLIWKGPCSGFPAVYIAGARMTLHQLVWTLRHDAPIPAGFKVSHTCGNRKCMEETHLVVRPNTDLSPERARVRNRPAGQRGFVGLRGEANHNAILDRDDVRYIRERCESGASIRSVAKEHGIAYSHCYYIVKHQIWTHL